MRRVTFMRHMVHAIVHIGIYFALFALLVFVVGCDSNKEMRERFGGKPRLLTDAQGRQYIVEHSLGLSYTVIPVPVEEEEAP